MSVLEVVALCADAGEHRLLHDVDLALEAGEVLVVLGESGAGKSTLGLALLGEAAPGVRLEGRVRLGGLRSGGLRSGGECAPGADGPASDGPGADLLDLDEAGRRRARAGRIAQLPQHPAAVLDPVRRVGSVLHEVAALVRHGRREREDAVAAACEAARLDPALLRRFPHQLSGGQQQRAALAQTLVTGPAILVLDEPTTGLDPVTATELVDRLRALLARGTALVLLTHDHAVARSLGGRAVVLDHGRVLRRGTVTDVLGPAPARDPSTGTAGRRSPRLAVRNLRIADGAGREVLRGIDLDAHAGELVAVVGRSGAGKTTLGRCVAGLCTGRGTITVDGETLPAAVWRRSVAQRRTVQYVHQDPRATFLEHRAVLDQVARPAVLLRGEDPAAARAHASALLSRLGLDPATCARRPRSLSGGQLQRAAVARALVSRPAVLVCDEVTSALDASNREGLLRAIDGLRRDSGTTVLLISHDLALVERVADRVAVVEAGLMVSGATASVSSVAGPARL